MGFFLVVLSARPGSAVESTRSKQKKRTWAGALAVGRVGLDIGEWESSLSADNSYWLSWPMMLNIGRNIPATMVPTMPPRKTIMIGSMAAVMLSTASSTSRS